MSTLNIYNPAGEIASTMEIPETSLVTEKGAQAVKDTVVAIMNSWRAGTACTKSKGQVSGTGKKPWKQKGTGRARVGTSRNPVWRGGGIAFGPKPRDYSVKVNKKVVSLAFQRAFSDKIVAGEVVVIEKLTTEAPKTKQASALLKKLGVTRSVLFVVSQDAMQDDLDRNFELAVNNIPNVAACTAVEVTAYDLCRFKTIVVTKTAMEEMVERLPVEENN